MHRFEIRTVSVVTVIASACLLSGCYEELDGQTPEPRAQSDADRSAPSTTGGNDIISGGNPSLGGAKRAANNVTDKIDQHQQEMSDIIDNGFDD